MQLNIHFERNRGKPDSLASVQILGNLRNRNGNVVDEMSFLKNFFLKRKPVTFCLQQEKSGLTFLGKKGFPTRANVRVSSPKRKSNVFHVVWNDATTEV